MEKLQLKQSESQHEELVLPDIEDDPPLQTQPASLLKTTAKEQSVMDRLGVDTTACDLATIFSEKYISEETHCVQRVRFVVYVYLKWVQYIKSIEDEDQSIDIIDLMENELPGKYSFIQLQVDFGRILRNKDLLKVKSDNGIDTGCTESECLIARRHERPKKWYSRNGDKMDSLFFMDRESCAVNDDEARRSVVVQQCLDSMHHYLEHRETIDIENVMENIKSENAQTAIKGIDEEIDVDALLHDRLVDVLDQETKQRQASGQYRRRNRDQFNKFMFTNNYQSTTNLTVPLDPTNTTSTNDNDDESKEDFDIDQQPTTETNLNQEPDEEIECEDCFVEQLYNELHLHGLDIDTVLKLRQYIRDQQYDTDSVVADCDGNKDREQKENVCIGTSWTSNICAFLYTLSTSNYIRIERLIDEFIFQYRCKTEEYSAGYRFYYWPFYKNNETEYVRVFQHVNDQNPGYKLKDWYIGCKFGSFKEEILSNPKSGFSMRDWVETMTKAEMKWTAYRKDPESRPLLCGLWGVIDGVIHYLSDSPNRWAKLYGIKAGDEAKIPHLMALLFYTNYTSACFEFSASFRKMVWNETDLSLKRRHSSFAHQGRLLRELVECFGVRMAKCEVSVFYHGINRDLIFRSTKFHVHCPVSTTSEFEVAHGTFSKSNGIVVDILNKKSGQMLFEAVLWSDYHEESEYFFIGGLEAFQFLTIHDIPKKRNYKSYIAPISMLQQMIRGYKFSVNQRPITKFDVKILDQLITDNLSESATSKIPVYIRRLFANFTNNVQRVEINMLVMDNRKEKKGFRFGPIRHLFFADTWSPKESVKLQLFTRLFNRSLHTIVIYNNAGLRRPFNPSIHLNSELHASLLSVFDEVSSNPLLRQKFQSIIILKPKDAISEFIADRQSEFQAIGWKLEQKGYQHPRRQFCSEALYISRAQ